MGFSILNPLVIIHFHGIFPYKPSILRYLQFMETPIGSTSTASFANFSLQRSSRAQALPGTPEVTAAVAGGSPSYMGVSINVGFMGIYWMYGEYIFGKIYYKWCLMDSIVMGVPQARWMVYFMENPMEKDDDWGSPMTLTTIWECHS